MERERYTVLFLEDDIKRIAQFNLAFNYLRDKMPTHDFRLIFTTTADKFINEVLCTYKINWMFLGHDLSGEQGVDSSNKNTGAEVVRWMEEEKDLIDRRQVETMFIHSYNSAGANYMYDILSKYWKVSKTPGIWEIESFKEMFK